MKIAVVTPNFTLAGVPVAQFRLANILAKRGHKVHLIVGKVYTQVLPRLEPKITFIHLQKSRARLLVIPLIKLLRKNNYDLVFSAEDHLTVMVVIAKLISRRKCRLVCSSRVTPDDVFCGAPFSTGWLLRKAYSYAMKHVDLLTCVSKEMVYQYQHWFTQTRHVAIYNPVVTSTFYSNSEERCEHKWFSAERCYPIFISIGRLAPWKRHEDLIRAFAAVRREIDSRLIIIGDGELRDSLEDLAFNLGLQKDIDFLGYLENPLPYLRQSDVFVLSSLVEGMPNVLIEAMALGKQIASTNCDTGPREVITDGYSGYLADVRSPASLTEAMIKCIRTPLNGSVIRSSVRDFEEGAVLERYGTLLGVNL